SPNRADQNRIEHITMRDVDQVEENTAKTGVAIPRHAVRLRWQSHCAAGDFVKTIIDRPRLSYVGKRNVDRDVAVRAEARLAIRIQQLGFAGISQHAATAENLDRVLANETLQGRAIGRFGVNVKVFSTGAVAIRWN